MDLNSNTAAVPIGDGIHDDTAAIQALHDTGASLVNLLGKVSADALPDLGCYECQERGELPTLIYMR